MLKVLLPYSLLAGIGVAVVVSNFRPAAEVVTASTRTAPVASLTGTAAPAGDATCAGCHAPVDPAKALSRNVAGEVNYYCCEHCATAGKPDTHSADSIQSGSLVTAQRHIDPVCHMEVTPAWGFEAQHDGAAFYFCTSMCRERFVESPESFLGLRCTVCKVAVDDADAPTATYLDRTYVFCSEEHRGQFKADPAAYFMHTMWGVPSWMYYVSIGLVLVVSFGIFEGVDGARRWKPLSEGLGMLRRRREPIGTVLADRSGRADRIDLLRNRLFHSMATSRAFRFALQAIVVGLFFLVIAAGLFGNQNPALNIAPLLTWTIWWGGLVILIMYAGKAWCYVCPWDAVAGWMEKLRFWKKSNDGLGLEMKWPRAMRNVVIATVLFVGLTWVELGFGVTMKPRVTAYLAIAMLLMAIVSAFLFERKGFCRYACLVGRVSGLYAMFSGVEVRARDAGVCHACRGKECVRGSDEAYACPTFLYPGGLATNTYCIQCMECVQACPSDNLTVNLRPWGADLATDHKARRDEAYLALLMLSITGFHGLTMTPNWARLTDWLHESVSLGAMLSFSVGMAGLMLAPIAIYALLVAVSYRFGTWATTDRPHTYGDYFVRYAYALLPIALFYHLAHNLEHLLMEGPKIVSLASDPFGWGWDLFGTLTWNVPPLVSLDVLWVLQIALVLVGHVYSLWAAQRTARHMFGDRGRALGSQLPMLVGMIAFSVFSLWLLKQPMEMRTSAM